MRDRERVGNGVGERGSRKERERGGIRQIREMEAEEGERWSEEMKETERECVCQREQERKRERKREKRDSDSERSH